MSRHIRPLLLAALTLVSACGTLEVRLEPPETAAVGQAPTRTPTTTQTRATGAATVAATSTPPPSPTSPPPTPTEAVTPTAVPEPQAIRFAEGATSATVTDTLAAGGANRYALRALAGQILSVDISAPHPVLLSVWGADGTVLKQATSGTSHWAGTLPSTHDYILELTSPGPQVDYHLTVTIPEATDPLPDLEASTYRNQQHGFAVRYPADFTEGMPCPTEGVIDDPVVSFRLVGASYYADTNLLDACVTVGVDPSQAARSTCREARDAQEELVGQEEISGIFFSRISRGGVATGHVYDVTSYRAVHAAACYEITLFLHYANPGVYGSETVSEFDEQVVTSRLEQILYSFRFLR